jgi:hypothetical protein
MSSGSEYYMNPAEARQKKKDVMNELWCDGITSQSLMSWMK